MKPHNIASIPRSEAMSRSAAEWNQLLYREKQEAGNRTKEGYSTSKPTPDQVPRRCQEAGDLTTEDPGAHLAYNPSVHNWEGPVTNGYTGVQEYNDRLRLSGIKRQF